MFVWTTSRSMFSLMRHTTKKAPFLWRNYTEWKVFRSVYPVVHTWQIAQSCAYEGKWTDSGNHWKVDGNHWNKKSMEKNPIIYVSKYCFGCFWYMSEINYEDSIFIEFSRKWVLERHRSELVWVKSIKTVQEWGVALKCLVYAKLNTLKRLLGLMDDKLGSLFIHLNHFSSNTSLRWISPMLETFTLCMTNQTAV